MAAVDQRIDLVAVGLLDEKPVGRRGVHPGGAAGKEDPGGDALRGDQRVKRALGELVVENRVAAGIGP